MVNIKPNGEVTGQSKSQSNGPRRLDEDLPLEETTDGHQASQLICLCVLFPVDDDDDLSKIMRHTMVNKCNHYQHPEIL